MLSIEEFRVLSCGHYFCVECLEAWYAENIVHCQKCREEEVQQLHQLVTPNEFERTLFFEDPPDGEEKQELEVMLHSQMIRRARAIR